MTTAMLFFLLKKNLAFYATMCHILKDQQAPQLARLIDESQQAQRSFWTAKNIVHHLDDRLLIL
jgi:hypothetical protein